VEIIKAIREIWSVKSFFPNSGNSRKIHPKF
jgi:hypothetical protein